MTKYHDRLRTARQKLIMEFYARRSHGSDNDVPLVDAIDEYVLAAISLAFATHPATEQVTKTMGGHD